MRRVAPIVLTALVVCLFVTAQNPPVKLSEPEKAAVVSKLAEILTEKYVFPETAQKMADLVRKNLQAGLYGPIENSDDFARKLSEDILSVSHDQHLQVGYAPEQIMMSKNKTGNDSDELQQLQNRQSKLNNYGFKEVKVLPGNVGYLKFNSFSSNPNAFPVAVGALAFLANADALIVDLRDNNGGDPQMIQVITSYFFEGEPRHLNSFYYREGDRTQQFWTLPYVPGKRMPETPIFVLTSNHTFSGAEEFTYNLKNLKRATIVGETTGGGAHPVNRELIDDNFWVMVPFARAINPISKTNWEGTGVEPDVKVPADKALDTALALALETIYNAEKDPRFKETYLWHLDAQRAKVTPMTLTDSALHEYAGTYGSRRITLENGSLYYQRDQRPRMKMIPLAADTFMFEELAMFRLKFTREGGKVTAVEGRYDNGRKDVSPRTR